MAYTNARRITQLESIVDEFTARIAADPTDADLPPLLAKAQAELADLKAAGTAAADTAAADKAAADATAAAAAAPAPAPAPAKPTSFRKAAAPASARAGIAIKPLPPTVPASMKAGGRPSPAASRPAPVAGTSRSGL